MGKTNNEVLLDKRAPGRPSKVEDVARRLNREIHAAMLQPGRRWSQAELLRRAKVAKSTLDDLKEHELIKPLRERIRALAVVRESADATISGGAREARQAVRVTAGVDGADMLPSSVLDEVRIAGLYGDKTRTAIGVMGRFIGRHRRMQHVSALPVTVRELELAVRQLQGILQELRPMSDQWLAGPGAIPESAEDESGALEFDLRMPD